MPKSKGLKIGLVALILLSGFGREYIMVNINWVVQHLSVGAPNYSQPLFWPLVDWTVPEIMRLKWGLTIVFTAYFLALTIFIIKIIFPENKSYQKVTLFGYLLLVIVSGVTYLIGYLIDAGPELYSTIRTLMGLAQSFVPLMVFYLLFKFMPMKNGYSEKK